VMRLADAVRRAGLGLAVACAAAVGAAAQDGVTVTPQEVDCVPRGQFWTVKAIVAPAAAKGKLYFRSDITPPGEWYYVDMNESQTIWLANGPKIGEGVQTVTYHVQADGPAGTGTSLDRILNAVNTEDDCKSKKMVPLASTGPSSVFSPSGGMIGFSAAGTTISAIGGSAAVGAAAAGGGGLFGLGTAATVGIVGGAVAVTATTIAVTNNNNPTTTAPAPTSTFPIPTTTRPPITIPPTTTVPPSTNPPKPPPTTVPPTTIPPASPRR
jgi:hypothetical protein